MFFCNKAQGRFKRLSILLACLAASLLGCVTQTPPTKGAVSAAPTSGPPWLAHPEQGVSCQVLAAAVGQDTVIGDVEQSRNVAGTDARSKVVALLEAQHIGPQQTGEVVVSDYYFVDQDGHENPLQPVRIFARAYACKGHPSAL